jgi:hypothetical protein
MAGNTVGSMTADAKLEVQSSQLDELDRRLGEGRETLLKDIVKQASENVERCHSEGGMRELWIIETINYFVKNGIWLKNFPYIYISGLMGVYLLSCP